MVLCHQMPMEQEDLNFPTFNQPINLDDAHSNPVPNLRSVPRMLPPSITPPNPPLNNKVGSRLFFKTRLCVKFKSGSCPYGNNCSFAHGPEELRRPPPNWQDIVATHGNDRAAGNWSDQHRINRLRICRKFYSGEACPYGDRCTFLHERPEMVRESLAIRVGTSEVPAAAMAGGNRSGFDNPESNGFVGLSGYGKGPYQKPALLMTKMCNQWKMTGYCPFGGDCIFVHGSELKKFGGHVEVEALNTGVVSLKHIPNPDDASQSKRESTIKHQKGSQRWTGLKKISCIYADWIDDLQPKT